MGPEFGPCLINPSSDLVIDNIGLMCHFFTQYFSLSLQLSIKGDLNLELASFNPRLAIWEPLLEPVEQTENVGQPEHRPWTFKFDVCCIVCSY